MKTLIVIIGFSYLIPFQTPQVKWNYFVKKNQTGDLELHLKARIQKGWHIYALNNNGGPGPTEVKLFREAGIKYEGQINQLTKPDTINDAVFRTKVLAFSGTAEFVQLIKRKDSSVSEISGFVKYMACSGSNCLPPKSDSFQVKLD